MPAQNISSAFPDSTKLSDPARWNRTASHYNDAVGRSTHIAAARLITLANTHHPLTAPSARAIDLAAGTGSLTHQLATFAPSLPILATDLAQRMLDQLIALRPNPSKSKIETQILDMANPFANGKVTEEEG
ncbi:MAG: hypothetical protein Q9221_006354 [Calogaya cf. arnoldii]